MADTGRTTGWDVGGLSIWTIHVTRALSVRIIAVSPVRHGARRWAGIAKVIGDDIAVLPVPYLTDSHCFALIIHTLVSFKATTASEVQNARGRANKAAREFLRVTALA